MSTTDEYAQLMTDFQEILSVTSRENILSKVLPAASCLEGKDTFFRDSKLCKEVKLLARDLDRLWNS